VWGVWLPRLSLKNKRLFWRDVHAVPAAWGAGLVGIMLVTGLTMTGHWGDAFLQLKRFYPAPLQQDVPKSIAPERAQTARDVGSDLIPTGAHGAAGRGVAVDLDAVIAAARAAGAPPGFTVRLPAGPEDVYTVSGFVSNPANLVTLHIDQYTGAVLADVRWDDYSPAAQAVEVGIAFHTGRYFGTWNQVTGVAASLLVIAQSVTGVVMWWRRRRPGRLGAPPMPANFPLWKGAVAVIAVLCVLFPLVGYSLTVVLLLDWLIISRLPPLQRALG
jgi:uncharacterized iron-regulated membrane protein